jgi:hypothetical protein
MQCYEQYRNKRKKKLPIKPCKINGANDNSDMMVAGAGGDQHAPRPPDQARAMPARIYGQSPMTRGTYLMGAQFALWLHRPPHSRWELAVQRRWASRQRMYEAGPRPWADGRRSVANYFLTGYKCNRVKVMRGNMSSNKGFHIGKFMQSKSKCRQMMHIVENQPKEPT